MLTSIKKKPSRKLLEVGREYNRMHPGIRTCAEHTIRRTRAWPIMGGVYRNLLKKCDRINGIVCGRVNYRLL